MSYNFHNDLSVDRSLSHGGYEFSGSGIGLRSLFPGHSFVLSNSFGVGAISQFSSLSKTESEFTNSRGESRKSSKGEKIYSGGDDAKRDCTFEFKENTGCRFVPYAPKRIPLQLEQRQYRNLKRSIPTICGNLKDVQSTFVKCLHSRPDGSIRGKVILTSTHFFFKYDDGGDFDENDFFDFCTVYPPQEDIAAKWLPKKSPRRWGKHAIERHNNRDYDAGDSSTESSTDSSKLSVDRMYDSLSIDSFLIRAVEEQAKQRLEELEEANKEVTDSFSISTCSTTKEKITRRCSSESSESDFSSISSSVLTNIPIVTHEGNEEEKQYYSQYPKGFKGFKLPLNCLHEIYPRKYRMKDTAVEIFVSTVNSSPSSGLPLHPLSTSSFVIDLHDSIPSGYSRRDQFVSILRSLSPNLRLYYWYTALNKINKNQKKYLSSTQFRKDPLRRLTKAWCQGLISNYDYLIRLNAIAGRSRFDLSHYPIMPWVLSNYSSSEEPDLTDRSNFRDLTKPMGALNEERLLHKFLVKYKALSSCSSNDSASSSSNGIIPFMYGSHYSTSGGVVMHYLVRLRPYAGLHRKLQGGEFDVPDRLFDSIPRTWDMCSRLSATEVKELTPEFYSDHNFLKNNNSFKLGKSQHNGKEIGDVILPPWSKNSPQRFIQIMRNALESDVCSSMLPDWIDLIFGFKQKGIEAKKAFNVFYYLTYYDTNDLAKIDDVHMRREVENHIADFGHCPTQLFHQPHPRKKI